MARCELIGGPYDGDVVERETAPERIGVGHGSSEHFRASMAYYEQRFERVQMRLGGRSYVVRARNVERSPDATVRYDYRPQS